MTGTASAPVRPGRLARWAIRSAVLAGLGLGLWLVSATTASADDNPTLPVSSPAATATHAGVVPLVTDTVAQVVEPVAAPAPPHVVDLLIARVIQPAVTTVVDPAVDAAIPVAPLVGAAPVQPSAAALDEAPAVAAEEPTPATTPPSTISAPDAVAPVAIPVPAPTTSTLAPLPSSAPPPALPAGTTSSGSSGPDGGAALPVGSTATAAPPVRPATLDASSADTVEAVDDPSFSPD
jgi:hypothetical protein